MLTVILGAIALVVVWVAVIAWVRKEKRKAAQADKPAETKPNETPAEVKPEEKKKNTWI